MKRIWKKLALALVMACMFASVIMPVGTQAATDSQTQKMTMYTNQTKTLYTNIIGNLTWSSSNKKVVTVTKKSINTAKIKTVGAGKATVRAKEVYSGRKVDFKITVKDPSLNAKTKSLKVGDTYTLELKGATAKKYTSDKPAVAKVSKYGMITAEGSGTATITVTDTKSRKYQCKVTVARDDKPATSWGFQISAWNDSMTFKVAKWGNGDTRTEDGGHIYSTSFVSNGGTDWAKDVVFDVEDVTPNAIRNMYRSMKVESGISSTSVKVVTKWSKYYYPEYDYVYDGTPTIMEPFDDSAETPIVRTERATVEQKLTIKAKIGTRAVKVTAKRDGKVLDTVYLTSTDEDSEEDAVKQDLEVYASVRHKVEEKLWTDDMTTAQKFKTIAEYVNKTTHYPHTDTVSKEYNPKFWNEWSMDGMDLYYNVSSDSILNRTMDFQGGIETCLAADILFYIAVEDLGLTNRNDLDVDEGEAVWMASGKESSNPSNFWHVSFKYRDAQGNVYIYDMQGIGHGGTSSPCDAHGCKQYIVSLDD